MENDAVPLFHGSGGAIGEPLGPGGWEGVGGVDAAVDVSSVVFFAHGNEIVAEFMADDDGAGGLAGRAYDKFTSQTAFWLVLPRIGRTDHNTHHSR